MRKLHLVCNAHMDPVWQWRWQEGLGAALSTFRVAADFCEQFDHFVFCHNEALLYEWVEQHDPLLFDRIKALVAAGKWKIMGGWYLQPDCNMPAGESIVRQMQTGYEYFMEKFGVRVHTAVNLDSFGHSKGLVQILQKAGYEGYMMMRPDPGIGLLDDLPQRFCWKGYSGSKVKGYRLNTPYNTLYGTAARVVEDYIGQNGDQEILMRCWGIGDHGGGPSRVDLTEINALIDRKAGEIEIIHSNPDTFMDLLDIDSLPVVDYDLNPMDAGCYTSMHKVKKLHRSLEGQLMMAERVSSLCQMEGVAQYPAEQLQKLWKDLMFAQFHDILPGTCVQLAEEDSVRLLHHGLEETDRLLTAGLYALARDQQPPVDGDIPLLVLNPHPYPVTDVFECEFMLADQNWTPNFTSGTVYCDGIALPTQMEKEASSMNLDWRKRVCFTATLKPMSVNRFDCRLHVLPEKPFKIIDMTREPEYTITAGETICVFDTRSGTIKSMTRGGVEYVRPGFGALAVFEDDCDPWLINRKSFGPRIGQFTLLDRKRATEYAGCEVEDVSPLRVIEDGDARTCVEALLGYDKSFARVVWRFPKQGGDVSVECTVHWNQHDTMLRMELPHAFEKATYSGQDMFGNKPLSTAHEMVAQRWVMAKDGGADRAMAILNDCCYGSLLTDTAICPSMLRAPTYTSHRIDDRPRLPLERYYARQDQGEHRFTFGILLGSVSEIEQTTDIKAQIHNEPCMAVSAFCGGYEKRKYGEFVVKGVRLDTCKPSKDGNGYVLRLFNYHDAAVMGNVHISALGLDFSLPFEGQEIKTVLVESGSWREVNLLTEQ